MTHDVFAEWGMFFALLIAGPYIIGIPLAIAWVAIDVAIHKLTGWSILPANVRGRR